MAEVNFSNTDNRNETRPQLSSYVKGAIGALNEHEYQKMSKAHNPYGDGLASGRILEFLA